MSWQRFRRCLALVVTSTIVGGTLLCAPAAFGQARGKGGGGDGGGDPPPDPAVAFVSSKDNSLYVMNADGTNQRRILDISPRELVRAPTWSPDGTQLVVRGYFDGVHGLYTLNADGSGLRRIVTLVTQEDRLLTFPDWSPVPAPDGNFKILFTDGVPEGQGYRAVYTCNTDGSGVTRLTVGPNSFFHAYACWTRDATGFIATRGDQTVRLFPLGIAPDGSLQTTADIQIHQGGSTYAFPKTANDHNWIIFTTSIPDVSTSLDLMILDITDPFNPQTVWLFDSGVDDRWASFSPDDGAVAFHTGGSRGGIVSMNLDGSGSKTLTGRGFDPNWMR